MTQRRAQEAERRADQERDDARRRSDEEAETARLDRVHSLHNFAIVKAMLSGWTAPRRHDGPP
jgi:hypothetical protein